MSVGVEKNKGAWPRVREYFLGRQVKADDCLALSLCDYIMKNVQSRQKYEELAH